MSGLRNDVKLEAYGSMREQCNFSKCTTRRKMSNSHYNVIVGDDVCTCGAM